MYGKGRYTNSVDHAKIAGSTEDLGPEYATQRSLLRRSMDKARTEGNEGLKQFLSHRLQWPESGLAILLEAVALESIERCRPTELLAIVTKCEIKYVELDNSRGNTVDPGATRCRSQLVNTAPLERHATTITTEHPTQTLPVGTPQEHDLATNWTITGAPSTVAASRLAISNNGVRCGQHSQRLYSFRHHRLLQRWQRRWPAYLPPSLSFLNLSDCHHWLHCPQRRQESHLYPILRFGEHQQLHSGC
ncbi:LOW QUALITY PROTEIN: hypothetical protein BC936DRAFT_146351 [Jimgerdemannia flammicorona]|uniref:Uncharacterized protein n=1 Tax=Jimgerdemannia flammicorona TaxID=994334 RepID=A0A433D7U5_9FUNG|nr:LOW QUALITY PROTEIN: hypothetical protein BC936DRAFT_146351 [Jimgerdemannia flammicorona]